MLDILKEIPEFSNWIKIEPVLKGWSDDQKFYIEDNLGNKLLLRLANISKYQTKKIEYEYLNKLLTLEISMTTPIKFGICCQYVYTLYKWIEGVDAEIGLKEYSKKEQYEFGIIAGKILKRIHSIPASENQEDWAIRFKRKISKKLDSYEKCAIKIPNDTFFIKFILDNLSCLDNRPQTFQHGDYHIGNLLITNEQKLAVIDFNRYDFGDPWEEFNRIVFSWKVSKPFAIGQIHGYFDYKVPDAFFQLLALYITVNAISSIPWAIPFGDSEVEFMLSNAKEIFESYDGFKTYIPNWYNK